MSARADSSEPDPTDPGVLSAAKQRDEDAWRTLANRYTPLILRWCARSGIQPAVAADIAQNVLLQLSQSLQSFRPDDKKAAFRRWLRTITRAKIADHLRREATQPTVQAGISPSTKLLMNQNTTDEWPPLLRSTQAVFRLREVLKQVEAEVEPTTWRAFWMTTVEEYSSPEASLQLGISPNAVRLAKSHVLRRLREAAPEFPSTDAQA
jgi:RNA polymerase sigma-70 factor, ECF subfamily